MQKGGLQLPREINKKCGHFLRINLTFQLVIQNKWQKVTTTSLFYSYQLTLKYFCDQLSSEWVKIENKFSEKIRIYVT